jgi:predicted RecA/RadA family phage recombinase
MYNYIQKGEVVSLLAPHDVVSGNGVKVGQIFGVATTNALSGAAVEVLRQGAVRLNKVTTQAWTAGALVYWDNSARLATTVSTSNLLIGAALAATPNPSTSGNVVLSGAPRADG